MTREEIISGLQMTMDLIQFDPGTGNVRPIYTLNDLDKTTYVACKEAIEALKAESYASERYADLCEYFDRCSDKGAAILHDRNEFKAWLERGRWHVEECDRLARELDALKAQIDKDTNVPSNDTISRQVAIDAILAVTGNSSVRELYEHVQEHGLSEMWSGGVSAAIDVIIAVPSAQPEERTEKRTETHACDCVSRQEVLDLIEMSMNDLEYDNENEELQYAVRSLPSAKLNFDMTTKIDKAYDDGYKAGYLQAKHDWGDKDE